MACKIFEQHFYIEPLTFTGNGGTVTGTPPTSVNTHYQPSALGNGGGLILTPNDQSIYIKDFRTEETFECDYRPAATISGSFYMAGHYQKRINPSYRQYGYIDLRWSCECDVPTELRNKIIDNPNQEYGEHAIENIVIRQNGTYSSSRGSIYCYTSLTTFPIIQRIITKHYDIDGVYQPPDSAIYTFINGSVTPEAAPQATGTMEYKKNLIGNPVTYYLSMNIEVGETEFKSRSYGARSFPFVSS